MANNFTGNDASTNPITFKSTETGGVHTSHVNVDNLPADPPTSAKQDLAKGVLDNILTALGSQSTAAKQDLAKGVLDNILTALGSQSTASKQDLAKGVLDNILTALGTTLAVNVGNFPGDPATATLQGTANTSLTAIKNAVELLDNAVTGTRLSVHVPVGTSPAYGNGACTGASQNLSAVSVVPFDGILHVSADSRNTSPIWVKETAAASESGLSIGPGITIPMPVADVQALKVFGADANQKWSWRCVEA